MRKILNDQFFNRPAVVVAQELIGKYLVRKIGKTEIALMITETEAYDGEDDRASHASRGKTKRNEVMFGEAGKFYVYFVYGMHHMINIVTGEKDYPAAVLIRGAGHAMGPGILAKILDIDVSFSGKEANRKTGVWFEDRGEELKPRKIKKMSRVGVSYAGPEWSEKKYRFVLV